MNTTVTGLENSITIHKISESLERLREQFIRIALLTSSKTHWYNPIKIGKPVSKSSYIRPYIRNRLHSTKMSRINSLDQ